jgi:hypothetical protein
MFGLILILCLIAFAVLKRKSERVWVLLDYAILAGLLLVPVICLGYDNVVAPPEDPAGFASWFFPGTSAIKGQGHLVVVAFILTTAIGIIKMTPLKTLFDKLGSWKSIIVAILGAIAELFLNWPSPATFNNIMTIFLTGAAGTGMISSGLHHALDGFKQTPPAA